MKFIIGIVTALILVVTIGITANRAISSWNYKTEIDNSTQLQSSNNLLKIAREKTLQVQTEQDGITQRNELKYSTIKYLINASPIIILLLGIVIITTVFTTKNSEFILKLWAWNHFNYNPNQLPQFNNNQITSTQFGMSKFGEEKWRILNQTANKNGHEIIGIPDGKSYQYYLKDGDTTVPLIAQKED